MDHEIKALYELASDVLMQTLNKPMSNNRRKRKAHELVSDATQCLYAACINLDMMVDE